MKNIHLNQYFFCLSSLLNKFLCVIDECNCWVVVSGASAAKCHGLVVIKSYFYRAAAHFAAHQLTLINSENRLEPPCWVASNEDSGVVLARIG